MEYAYPLVVGGRDPIFWNSNTWDNFVNYTRDKLGETIYDLETLRMIINRELAVWNAFNDPTPNTISFKTEADRTCFLLRFS